MFCMADRTAGRQVWGTTGECGTARAWASLTGFFVPFVSGLLVGCQSSPDQGALQGSALTDEPRLFWNCGGGKTPLSVAYVRAAPVNGDGPAGHGFLIDLKVQRNDETFVMTATVANMKYAQQMKQGTLVHSFLLSTNGATLNWGQDATAPVTAVSLNFFSADDHVPVGNHRLHLGQSRSFAPPSIRFNNECRFYHTDEILFRQKQVSSAQNR